MEDQVLTTTQTAKLLGISVRTAQLLIESGGLPSWKTPGGHRRVHRSDVEALMDQAPASARTKSATVFIVAPLERQARFEAVFGTIRHVVPHFFADTWLAAVASGARAPALAVVDLDGLKEQGVGLLQSLAIDIRLKHTRLVAVTGESGSVAGMPARVHRATLDALVERVHLLTQDPPELIRQTVSGDFPVAPNEASRLQAVQRSGLVHTPAEEAFDRVTGLAARGLASPIALMSVLTPDLQWFKSRRGLEMSETPRSWAFCNYTLLQNGVFEVPDLTEHPAFARNPAVENAPHFRFYAGAPVYDPDGFALGSICIIDYKPRALDGDQKQTLLELAAIASDEVRLREMAARD